MTTTELQIDADLTDNVSAVVRLFNQRDWNVQASTAANMAAAPVANVTPIIAALRAGTNADEFDIGVDLAYIELKEFLYSPLTLKIGRQDLWYGKGFIVGANLRDPHGTVNAAEYTAISSFDAVRAILDYDPWTIDSVFALILENDIGSKDDEALLGTNVGYIFDVYNAEAEAYWFNKQDRSTVPARNVKEHNNIHTVGLRGSADPIENWTIAAEGAYQFGDFVGFRDQLETRDRSAYALDINAECRHFRDGYAWKPVVGTEYILYSGNQNEDRQNLNNAVGQYEGWDMMYRGKFDTAYREFVGTFNVTHQGLLARQLDYIELFEDASVTNQHQVAAYGSLAPTDSLTIDGRLSFFWQQYARTIPQQMLNPGGLPGDDKRNEYLGSEIDISLTWDYTEDVSFGLLTAWFFPGAHYADCSDDTATDVVGTVKLSF
ncbi:MAG: alginate export family protein [Candidatus Omnitrophota bacterium]